MTSPHSQLIATIAVAVAGFLGNLIWLLINLRVAKRVHDIESRITARLDALKERMDDRYMAAKLADERHSQICRRLDELPCHGIAVRPVSCG